MTTYTQPKHTLPLYECVLCKDEYMGYGNNATPVAEGKCCDNCNFTQVISARLVNTNDKSTKQTKMMTNKEIDTEIEALTQRLADLKAMKRNLEVEEEEEESECYGCAKTYIVDTNIGDQFCNDCGEDGFCLECLDYSNGRNLEYTEFLCMRCDENRNLYGEGEDNEDQEG